MQKNLPKKKRVSTIEMDTLYYVYNLHCRKPFISLFPPSCLQVSQYLPFRFKTIGKTYSTIELEYKSAIGNFKNPENHQFNFQVLNHNYQEVGLVWNRFLGRKFDVGFSYRLGYYQTSLFKDNFGLQIRLSGF